MRKKLTNGWDSFFQVLEKQDKALFVGVKIDNKKLKQMAKKNRINDEETYVKELVNTSFAQKTKHSHLLGCSGFFTIAQQEDILRTHTHLYSKTTYKCNVCSFKVNEVRKTKLY